MFKVKHLISLVPCCLAGAALLPAAGARASTTTEQALQALAGHWEGEAQDGAKLTFTVQPAQGDLVVTGNWKVEGGALAGDADFGVLHLANLFYMIPDKNAFAPGKEAYSLMHLPSGGLRFVRLAHPAEDQTAVQSEEIEVGKVRPNGTRTFKVVRGERVCADAANPAGKPCGQGVTESILIHKIAE